MVDGGEPTVMATFLGLLLTYYTVGLAVLLLLMTVVVALFVKQWPMMRDYGKQDTPSSLDAVGLDSSTSHRRVAR